MKSNSAHAFCRILLSEARAEAKEKGVTVPRNITALRSTRDLFFVESDGRTGEYVKGCCGFEARANFLRKLIDAKEAQ